MERKEIYLDNAGIVTWLLWISRNTSETTALDLPIMVVDPKSVIILYPYSYWHKQRH